MADVGASKEMLLHQLNALMADAAGDAETMELYQAKLAELDAARRANADLEQQLLTEAAAKENLQRQLASVAQDAKTATDALHDQLQTALADKVDLERHLESIQRELGDVQEAKNAALGDLDRSQTEVDSFGTILGPKIGPRNRSNICLGGPGANQGRRRLPRGLQGAILEPFGTHFGAILGAMLGRFGINFGIYFKPRRPATTVPQRPSFPVSQGRRVPALALTIS